MAAQGGGEGHLCPTCGKEVDYIDEKCPGCGTSASHGGATHDNIGNEEAMEQGVDDPSSPAVSAAVSRKPEDQVVTVAQHMDIDVETNETDSVPSTDPKLSEAADSSETTAESASTVIVDDSKDSDVESDIYSSFDGSTAVNQLAQNGDDIAVVRSDHFGANMELSDARSDEDIFCDAIEKHEASHADGSPDSSDSSSMTTWEIVRHNETGTPPTGSDENDQGLKPDAMSDSMIDAVAEAKMCDAANEVKVEPDAIIDDEAQDEEELVQGSVDTPVHGDVEPPTQGAEETTHGAEETLTHRAGEPPACGSDEQQTRVTEETPTHEAEEEPAEGATAEPHVPGTAVGVVDKEADVPMDVSDSEEQGSASDGGQIAEKLSDLHVDIPEEGHASQPEPDMPDESETDLIEVVVIGDVEKGMESRSSSCDYGITESADDNMSENSAPENLVDESAVMSSQDTKSVQEEQKVPESADQKPGTAESQMQSMMGDSIETSMAGSMSMVGSSMVGSMSMVDSMAYGSYSMASLGFDIMCQHDVPPPPCDGEDSDEEPCDQPISDVKRCPNCGQKNKFVRCKKQHDDGSHCKMFIGRQGGLCACCDAIEAAKAVQAMELSQCPPMEQDLMCHADIKTPLCDGTDSETEEACNQPVSEDKFCSNCGEKNKYVRCKKPHDDGTPCMMFIRRGGPCQCCEAAEAAKAMPPKPAVCDGKDDDGNPCNTPIDAWKFCSECGKKNKYLMCKGEQEDGALCRMFVLPGKKCPWCQTFVEAPKPRSKKKAVAQKKTQSPMKETELRAMPAPKRPRTENTTDCDPANVKTEESTTTDVAVSREQQRQSPPAKVQPCSVVPDGSHVDDAGQQPSSHEADTQNVHHHRPSARVQEVEPCSIETGSSSHQQFSEHGVASPETHHGVVPESSRSDEFPSAGQDSSPRNEQNDEAMEGPSSPVVNNHMSEDEVANLVSEEESATEGERCRIRGGVPQEGQVVRENIQGSKDSYAQMASRSGPDTNQDQNISENTNAGVFSNSNSVQRDAVGESRIPPDTSGKVFGTGQDVRGEDHPLAHIDDKNGNVGKERSASVSSREEDSASTDGRKRDLENSQEGGSDVGGKKSKDASQKEGGVWYRKKDNEPEDSKYNLRGRNKNAKGADNAAIQRNTSDRHTQMRKVRFHVVVHRNYKFNEKTDIVMIRFQHLHLGGWNADSHRMELVQKYEKGYALLQLEVYIPEYIRETEYKYALYRTSKNKFIWEYMPTHGQDVQHIFNRKLKIPYAKTSVEFDQYDGLMYRPPEETGFVEKVKKGVRKAFGYERKEIVDEVKEATWAMLPRWHWFCFETAAGQALSFGKAEEVIQNVDSVFRYLENSFVNMTDSSKKDAWGELFWDYLSEWQATVSAQNVAGKWTQEVLQMRMVSALTILRLTVKWNTLLADEVQMDLLCDCLLLRPDKDGKILPLLEVLNQHFEKPRTLLFQLLVLCKMLTVDASYTMDNMTRHKWMFVVPLIHLLNGDAVFGHQVWDAYGAGHSVDDGVWWGIRQFPKYQRSFKEKMDGYKLLNLELLVKNLQPLFKIDYLLPRTLMSVLSLRHIKFAYAREAIPLDCCIANCIYYIKSRTGYINDENYRHMTECLNVILEKARKFFPTNADISGEQKDLAMKEVGILERITWDLMNLLLLVTRSRGAWVNGKLMIPIGAQLLITLLDTHYRMVDWIPNDQEDCIKMHRQSLMNYLEEMKAAVVPWLHGVLTWSVSNRLSEFADAEEPKLWSNLLKVEFATEKPRNIWRTALLNAFENRVQKLTHIQQVEMYCGKTDFSIYDKGIDETLSKVAFEAVSQEVNVLGITSYNQTKYKELVSRMFRQAWTKAVGTGTEVDNEKVMLHLMAWPSFVRCLEIFSTDKRKMLFDMVCIDNITLALSVLSNQKDLLLKHQLCISDLERLQQHREAFITLCCVECIREDDLPADAKKAKQQSLRTYLTEFFQIRQFELDYFKRVSDKLLVLLGHCRDLPCDIHTDSFANVLKGDLGKRRLADIIEPAKSPYHGGEKPNITLFGLSQRVFEVLEKVKALSTSIILNQLWTEYGITENKDQGPNGVPLQLDEAVEKIWDPAWDEWTQVIAMLSAGNITLKQVDKYFGCFKQEMDDIKVELECMHNYFDDTRQLNVEEIFKQIQLYYTLDAFTMGAMTILRVKKEMELTGDFSQVETLANVTEQKHQPLRKMNRDLLKTGKILENITKQEVECLNAVAKCKNLVKWLKKIGGTKQLKVFVDLASTTAGEGDMDLDRVSMLHAVVMGYAPLICDLKQDASAEVFLEHCKMVWRALKADSGLTKKLLDTQRHMAWLNFIKDSHGSIEVSCLGEVDSINKRGIYKVGNLKKGHKDVRDVITLTVPAEKQEPKRTYNFDQLNELQSKLMLVSSGKKGQGDDSQQQKIDRFTEIFEGVTRLSKAYMKICCAGNVLFQDWVSTLYCNIETKNNVRVDFHLEKGILMEKNQGELTVQIHNLATFMESCLGDWYEYLLLQRGRCPQLNHFTTEQIVHLRREVAQVTNKDVDYLTYNMLHSVKTNCKRDDLIKAVRAVHTQLQEKAAPQPMEEEEEEDEEMPAERTANVMELTETLMGAGFSERLAVLAIKEKGLDEDDCFLWCMENRERVDNADSDDEDGDQTMHDAEEQDLLRDLEDLQPATSMKTVTTELLGQLDRNERSLCAQLKDLWKNFLGTVSMSVKDYRSVEHLGMILDHLSDREDRMILRTFQPYLRPGQPNLIVCPEADIYNMVLSLYLDDPGLPLPDDEEILLCTSNTTAEEVDLLWQRATCDQVNQGKIFCLVNADKLDYDVSDSVEKSLEKHIKGKRDYRLVIICSSEREDKSRMVTALDRNRRNAMIRPVKAICEYLKKQFQKDFCGDQSAPNLDHEKCSVRLVKSSTAGVGKTLIALRMSQELKHGATVGIPLHERYITESDLVEKLIVRTNKAGANVARLFHIDIGHDVVEGVDHVLFNLLVLRCIKDATGRCWRRSPADLYLIENLPLLKREVQRTNEMEKVQFVHRMLNILPSVTCRPPKETLKILRNEYKPDGFQRDDPLLHNDICTSQEFQRPYRYLKELTARPDTPPFFWLEILLRYCGVENPSWSELRNFISFLNIQLQDCEHSIFCSDVLKDDLPGFTAFVVNFMIQMSEDFATRSLTVSEETPQLLQEADEDEMEVDQQDELPIVLRRKWETSPHPYIFFNPDHHSITFLGFNIDKQTGNLIDQQTRTVLKEKIMSPQLFEALNRQGVNLLENFDNLSRADKIIKLCTVMGTELVHDPDETYELTTDNVKKMLAIYMRFRCNIPVVVMGETGCGKTRLIKFMCDLQVQPGIDIKNMVLMKVHGGTSHEEIIARVQEAQTLAANNRAMFPKMDTILFFDEANTTEAIGLIKEIMCDGSMNGVRINIHTGLKFVAACNPYRKHSQEMIQNLEQAGLGYNVKADRTADKLGRVPMRQLVYRVQPLPQSMLPLVWDFGQLSDDVEKMYIKQIVQRYIVRKKIPDYANLNVVITNILAASQDFMRQQQNECSFVSLRDVERTMDVMAWFFSQRKLLYRLMDGNADAAEVNEEEEVQEEDGDEHEDDVTRSLILALGVCYHACLKEETRVGYRQHIARFFQQPCNLPDGADTLDTEISTCQDVFLDQVQIMEPNIAHNQALKENLFMMVVCIELRIPLFLVGKPGSSKSLAKLIVTDAMQGETARMPLFKALKQVHMISYQCSPLATPDGIKGTFKQCARFQKDKNLDQFVSVVVLDEVGLAEDSPRMPLKTLHPLLEDGTCGSDDKPEPHKKVAFIGISNWALDPAKMNRGILVQRGVPDEAELQKSAQGICATDMKVLTHIKATIPNMAKAYLELYNSALDIREFFGLRDFYSLVKMVYAFAAKSRRPPTWFQFEHAVRRNFGGLENIDPVHVFAKHVNMLGHNERPRRDDPRCDPTGLIEACLYGNEAYKESRYLLILTENYAALGILQQHLLTMRDTIVIFGSSFRSDQEYTQVCRNISRIKKCMDTGKTVVLLNLESLYESLYDALNQYYVYMGGQRYVDLGLGTHRVKCRVDEKFRLIVVAEKEVVYEKFPIPLINRLEKHFLAMSTVLDKTQIRIAKKVDDWATKFVTQKPNPSYHGRAQKKLTPGDVFCGYHADTAASIVLQVTKALGKDPGTPGLHIEVFERCREILLACATPDSVLRLKNARLDQEEEELVEKYFADEKHRSLQDHVMNLLKEYEAEEDVFLEVTTRSHLLAKKDAKVLGTFLKIRHWHLLALQAMDTKQQFSRELSNFYDQKTDERIMLLQCDSGDQNSNLIACARYQIMEEYNKAKPDMQGRAHFVFIIQMPRVVAGTFIGFQGGQWHSVHLDDLRPPAGTQPSVISMKQQSIGHLINDAVRKHATPTQEDTEREREEMEMEIEGLQFPDTGTPMPMEVSDSLDPEQIKLLDLGDLPRKPSADELQRIMQMSTQRAQVHDGCGDAAGEGMSMQNVPAPGRLFDRTQEVLDIDALILSCLQGAASMIKDPDTVAADRATQRLQLLTKELTRQEGPSLMESLRGRIAQLLLEKENTVNILSRAQDWLSKEAAAPESINKAGTFSRAIEMVIEAKITPILAGLLAYMDTNSNLDILRRRGTARDNWIYTLWLKTLASGGVTQLSYERLLLSPKLHSELTEMIAQQTAIGHLAFKPLFPFSWEVYSQMERIIQTAKTMEDEGLEQTCQRLFNDSTVGKFFTEFANDRDVTVPDEMMDLYISDFIHMSVRCGQDGMQQILMKSLKAAFRETRSDLDREDDDLYGQLTIPKLHLTYLKYSERFEHFIQACLAWSECTAWLRKTPEHELNQAQTEMTLDVNILVKMVEYISSLDEKLKTPKGRQEWSEKVKSFKPVIDGILHSKQPRGALSMKYLDKYRSLWVRICVVQLFMDHVCPPHIKEEAGRVDNIKPLWMFLGKEANLRTPKSLKKVAEFLRTCKFGAVKKFYKTDSKCHACDEPMTEPVTLPCKHIICRTCLQDQINGDGVCLECKQPIPDGFRPPMKARNKQADVAYGSYIRACNEFFMDLVSQLCFAEDQPPTKEVIEILMSYVIHEPRGDKQMAQRPRTKELTVYDECIDPSPVLRSLLLQLMLRYSSDDVREHLQYYFERSQRFLQDPQHILELSLLCARCFEDSYHSQCGLQPGNAIQSRVKFATAGLRAASADIGSNQLDIMKVEAVAKARFGMSVAAEMMNRIILREEEDQDVHSARKLWDAARRLHENSDSRWPRLYLAKQLCRNYGMDSLETVAQKQHLNWVLPDEARDREDNGVDRFILFSPQYQIVRDALGAVTLGGSDDDFRAKCQGLNGDKQLKEVSCLLALQREVYTRNLFEQNVQYRVNDQIINNIENVCMNQAFMGNKQALRDMLQGVKSTNIAPTPVVVDRLTRDIWDLLIQTSLVMQTLNETPLLKPYMTLMSKAGQMRNAYLPVMPQDHLEEAREALLAARRAPGGDDNPVFYTCSRGHPYVIGNCGRPVESARCWCGSDIGGKGYQLNQGNTKLEHRDETKTGYVLGPADMRNVTPIPERTLTPAAATILRLLLHLSMHIGTKADQQGVTGLIQPAVAPDQVRPFLLDHIRHDIQVLGRAINKSPDDCLSLMTTLIRSFMDKRNTRAQFNANLGKKEDRREWEKAFVEAYVNPLLNDLDNILNNANERLANDDRLSNNPLIKIIHEMVNFGDKVDISKIHDCHMMWQYRSRVTVDHLTQLMNENAGDKCEAKILKQFLQEEHHLRLLSRLPDIIRLQQKLIQRYQRRINQAEARTTKIKEVLHDLPAQQRDEWILLLENFTQAWNSVREHLQNYSAAGYTLPDEMCKMAITPNAPVAMLIPSHWGLGLCSVMLVEYLTRKQNEFIMAYCRYRKKDSSKLPQCGVKEATAAHLIFYDPEKDLLPMVLAHCNYSLEVGKGTVINYDFIGLERELEERLLRGKPKLMYNVAPMTFKTEYRNAMVIFGALRDNIRQEPMSHAVQMGILQENRVYQDLCETIANLDITIAWLRDIRREPETRLVKFMVDTLEMEKKILSPQIQLHCLLMHVQSLWLLLTMERSKQLKYFDQDAFEDVSEEYHVPLEADAMPVVKTALQNINIDRFVSELYECILLNINIQQNRGDEDFQDNTDYSLADVMVHYIDSKDGTEIPALANGTFPREIKVKHAVAVWSEAVKVQRSEERNRRH